MKFRCVCKHWSVYFGFHCLFTFFWLFVLVFNVYLHFFGVNTLCFEKFSKIWNRNFENFEISLCLQTLVCLFWFSMFIYIFLIVCFGFQCLFTFFWCKHTLFWKIFENLQSNAMTNTSSPCLMYKFSRIPQAASECRLLLAFDQVRSAG